KFASKTPGIANFFFKNKLTSGIAKKAMGIAEKRQLPRLSKQTVWSYYQKNKERLKVNSPIKTVYLFNDEFTNFLDAEIGIDALELLAKLKYQVIILKNSESGRSHISKGFLEEAKVLANKNINLFKDIISAESPLLGI